MKGIRKPVPNRKVPKKNKMKMRKRKMRMRRVKRRKRKIGERTLKKRRKRIQAPTITSAKMRISKIEKGGEAENINSRRVEDINKVDVKNNKVGIEKLADIEAEDMKNIKAEKI